MGGGGYQHPSMVLFESLYRQFVVSKKNWVVILGVRTFEGLECWARTFSPQKCGKKCVSQKYTFFIQNWGYNFF